MYCFWITEITPNLCSHVQSISSACILVLFLGNCDLDPCMASVLETSGVYCLLTEFSIKI